MTSFSNIQDKLTKFIKKYYTNELIRGVILFAAFGLLYFLFTLFVEHFLWLQPAWRSVLFFLFIAVELLLLIRFIILPIFKLIGLRKRITHEQASKIIGNHFPEVDDKLLNVLQLSNSKNKSELFLASIEQKSLELQPIPFKSAINYTTNKKYLKYLAIPLLIWFFTVLSGNKSIFKQSLDRVVHYKTAYEAPAPFSFKILNKELNSIEGKSFELIVETQGDVIPENAQIYFNDENYFLKELGSGRFGYNFESINKPLSFYIEANGVRSRDYQIQLIKAPVINGFSMELDYPSYTQKKNETIENTGNATVPEGTKVTWNLTAQATDSINLLGVKKVSFLEEEKGKFSLSKRIRNNLKYQITTSNKQLKNYEQLNYNLEVIRDQHPKIEVKSDIDSVSRGPVQFAGQLSDDYGVSKLQLVYYEIDDKENFKTHVIEINKSTFEEFYYLFIPNGELDMELGKDYEMYFQVFDNDRVNGSKSAKSQTFRFHNKTKQELSDDILKEQKESLTELDKTAKDTEKLTKDFEEFTDKLKKKSEIEWNDKKEFEQFLKRQEQYEEMFEKQTDKLRDNLEELNENDETIKDRKEELQKRIEETKDLKKKQKILDELKKLAEKLDREGLINKLDKLAEQQKQEKRSLERLLELTKRFYVEKKAADIANKLDSLSKKQDKLSETEQQDAEQQKELNKEFDEIQKDLEEMRKQNEGLREPMPFPDLKREEKQVDQRMNDATNELEKFMQDPRNMTKKEMFQNGLTQDDLKKMIEEYEKSKNQSNTNNKSRKSQKYAGKKMQQMSQQLQQSMSAMQGEMMQENIETLRAILENLVTFSLDQEALMLSLDGVDAGHPSFPAKLKKQQLLKEHFEHIDDSLYVLSMRQQKLSAKIQKDITEAHYNIDKSLENIAENRMQQGVSNQQYTMTAANNLADMLSDMLNSMQNPSSGDGKGGGQDFQLPDIIKKQGEMKQKMEGMMKDGDKLNNSDGNKEVNKQQGKTGEGNSQEQMSGEQYQLYQEQQLLRQQLEELMKGQNGNHPQGQKAVEKMKQLEEQLLDKGFTNEVLQNMLQLEHELLKLEDARLKQGKDNKREATSNTKSFQDRKIQELLQKKQFFNLNEILNREPLPLRNSYKKKVQEYFKNSND